MQFSIIIPVYNVEKYLIRCVESVQTQTFQDFEVILIDDGSPDNCPQMCDSIANTDSRIRVIHKTNHGLGLARNTGMEVAEGDYIVFIDSDDFIHKSALEVINNSIVNNFMPDICR